jgi:hypothetical protein
MDTRNHGWLLVSLLALQLWLLVVVLAPAVAAQSQSPFSSVVDLTGYLSAWTSPPASSVSRGCPASYELAGPGTGSTLTALPCNAANDAKLKSNSKLVKLAGYTPLIGLTVANPARSLVYSVLAVPSLSTSQPMLLVTFSLVNGTAEQLLTIPSAYSPLSMTIDPTTGLLYMLASEPAKPTQLAVLTINAAKSAWSTALETAAPFVPNTNIVPLGSSLVVRDEWGSVSFLYQSKSLLAIVGGLSSAAHIPTWHLVSINVVTGKWYELLLSDSTILASNALSVTLTALLPSNFVLVASAGGAWLLNLTAVTGSTTVKSSAVNAYTEHLSRAQTALACGTVSMALDSSPVTIAASNSSLPYVLLPLYAQPTLLSAVRSPFWYYLYIDAALDIVTYSSIDSPALLLAALTPPTSVTTVSSSSGQLAYNPTKPLILTWTGTGFAPNIAYYCSTNTSSTVTKFINSTAICCTLPAGLPTDNRMSLAANSSGSILLQLLADDAYSLYQSRLVIVRSSSSNHSVSASALPRSAVGRMMVSYSVSSSVTPSPVITAAAGGAGYAPIRTATGTVVQSTPLQLHGQVTRGSVFLTQQLLHLSVTNPTVTAAAVLPAVRAALSQSDWSSSVGLNDAYALFAASSQAAAVDWSNMTSIATGVLASDTSSLPQILSPVITQTGAASTLALDTIGSQAQGWLETNVALPTALSLLNTLDLGAVLPSMSTPSLTQLSAIGVNSLLQAASSSSLVSDVMSDPTVSALLSLPSDISSVLDDPTQLIASVLPAGAVKDTVLALLGGGDDGSAVTLAGGLADTTDALLGNLGDAVSDLADTVTSTASSFLDDIAGDASDIAQGDFAGALGSLTGTMAITLGADTQVATIISGAVSVVGGVGEIFCGDVVGGITDIVSGVGNLISCLFGCSSPGPDETQLLGQQMAANFTQVLNGLSKISSQINNDTNLVLQSIGTLQTNLLQADANLSRQINTGFTQLANLTVAVFTQLQQQQYNFYSSEMGALANISAGLYSLTLSSDVALARIAAIQQSIDLDISDGNQNRRDEVLQTVNQYITNVQTAIANGWPTTSPVTVRSLPKAQIGSYQKSMAQVCSWAYGTEEASDPTMSGNLDLPLSSLALQINQAAHYDLVIALIPVIVNQYLNLQLPQLLTGSTTTAGALPNPLAWAYAANFWLEARQAALQTPNADANCLTNLWQTGQQLQATVRLAVSPTVLVAAYSQLNAAITNVVSYMQAVTAANSTGMLPSDWYNSLEAQSGQQPFTAFDQATAVSGLLLSLARGAGLGANGFTDGFVLNGQAEEQQENPNAPFAAGQAATSIAPFAPVVSTASFLTALKASSNPSAVQSGASLLSASIILLNWTSLAVQNAISAFYPPCTAAPYTVSQSLPVIDTTLRRLVGYMMQTHYEFFYQGVPVALPTVPSLAAATVKSSSSAARSSPSLSSSPTSSIHRSSRSSSAASANTTSSRSSSSSSRSSHMSSSSSKK